METPGFSQRYRKSFAVRRRRQGDRLFLIHVTDILEVDTFSDGVYALCDGDRTCLDIARMMIARYASDDALSVSAHVLYNLAVFERQGFIVSVDSTLD